MGTAWFANEGNILTMLFDIDDESEPRERRAHLEGLREVITWRLGPS